MHWQSVKQSVYVCVTIALVGLIVQPYLSAAAVAGLPSFSSAQVGAVPCVEQSKNTQADVQCGFPQSSVPACPESQALQKQYKLGVTDTVPLVIVEVSGNAGVTVTIPQKTGCPNNQGRTRQYCQSDTGIQFTSANTMKAYADETPCQTFKDECECKIQHVMTTITLPMNIFQQILANCNCNVDNSFEYPEVLCVGDFAAACTPKPCPGTNGGQTWILKPRGVCP